jgi:hypothetical protein
MTENNHFETCLDEISSFSEVVRNRNFNVKEYYFHGFAILFLYSQAIEKVFLRESKRLFKLVLMMASPWVLALPFI